MSRGFRLLDLTNASNRPVPLRNNPIRIAVRNAGGTEIGAATVTTDGNGHATATIPGIAATAATAGVTDRDGNTGDDPL